MKRIPIGDTLIVSTDIDGGDRHNRRERETKAVESLLSGLYGDKVKVEHTAAGAPVLKGGDRVYISISHSENRAVVAINPSCPVGIDTETLRPQLARVVSKFLSIKEQERCTDLKQLLIAWCIKEAAYKAAQIEGLDFANDIVIEPGADHTVMVSGVEYKYDIVENEDQYVTVLVTG